VAPGSVVLVVDIVEELLVVEAVEPVELVVEELLVVEAVEPVELVVE